MNYVKIWLFGFFAWITSFFRRDYKLHIVEGEFPSLLKPNILYVLTEDEEPWEAKMVCPCGCSSVLDLNLLPDGHPQWRFSADPQGRATLHPSVWRQVGCKSHFFLRAGKIVWV